MAGREAHADAGEDGAQYPWDAVPDLWKDADGANFDKAQLEAVFPAGRPKGKERQEIWAELDYNGNGYVSLAEFDGWFNKRTLPIEAKAGARNDGSGKSEIFRYARPCLIRAFQLANSVAPVDAAKGGLAASGDDYITKPELRLLMVALQAALAIYRLFDVADTSDDRRVSRAEWEDQLGTINAELRAQGYSGSAVTGSDFDKVDRDGGGMILLGEAVEYFISGFTKEGSLVPQYKY